jgi:hypothetical protein
MATRLHNGTAVVCTTGWRIVQGVIVDVTVEGEAALTASAIVKGIWPGNKRATDRFEPAYVEAWLRPPSPNERKSAWTSTTWQKKSSSQRHATRLARSTALRTPK